MMNVFRNAGETFLQIKDHTFFVLNGFKKESYNGDEGIYFIQCTTDKRDGIVKEYLPNGWDLTKKRIGKRMVYSLYKKDFFKFSGKNPTKLIFIACNEAGALYLMRRWILEKNLIPINDASFEEISKIDFYEKEIYQISETQTLSGVILRDIGDYFYNNGVKKLKQNLAGCE